jgi:hypothetical protein
MLEYAKECEELGDKEAARAQEEQDVRFRDQASSRVI